MNFFIFALLSVVYYSIIEWILHRFVMHQPLGKFVYPYNKHARVHHRIFKSDETYFLQSEGDKSTIPMAWWNGPTLIIISVMPALLLSLKMDDWRILVVNAVVGTFYYGAYEYSHWCMHLPLPKRRVIERINFFGFRPFYRLNGHHLLHHRYMHKNFNVVLPIADLLFGTLLLRSKVRFAQAQGLSVPDVQPRTDSGEEALTQTGHSIGE